MESEELSCWIRFSMIRGLALKDAVTLLKTFGGPDGVFSAGRSALKKAVTADAAEAVAAVCRGDSDETVERTERWAGRTRGAFVLTLADPDYPPQLLESAAPPFVLYGLGRRELLSRRLTAVFGTRHPDRDGEEDAYQFGRGFAASGLTLLTSAMEGTEAASLRGALDGTPPEAVIVAATSLERVYPASSAPLFMRTARAGLILSPFPSGTAFSEETLSRRYEVEAGLCSGAVLMQAGRDSKALSVLRVAGALGREIMAVPGNIHSAKAKGPNRMIRNGAVLVECIEDVASEVCRLSERPVRHRRF